MSGVDRPVRLDRDSYNRERMRVAFSKRAAERGFVNVLPGFWPIWVEPGYVGGGYPRRFLTVFIEPETKVFMLREFDLGAPVTSRDQAQEMVQALEVLYRAAMGPEAIKRAGGEGLERFVTYANRSITTA